MKLQDSLTEHRVFIKVKSGNFSSHDKMLWSILSLFKIMQTHSYQMLSEDSSLNLKPPMIGAPTYNDYSRDFQCVFVNVIQVLV